MELKAVVHVPTEEELEVFLDFCDRQGLSWPSHTPVRNGDNWLDYKQDTCYFIEGEKVTYSSREFATNEFLSDSYYAKEFPENPELCRCSTQKLIEIVECGVVDLDAAADFDELLALV